MVSIHYLQEVLYGIFKKPIIGPVKFKMAEIRHLETEIRHLENRHDAFFSAVVGSMWTKFGRLMQNDMPTTMI